MAKKCGALLERMNKLKLFVFFILAVVFVGCSNQTNKSYKFHWDDLCNDNNGQPIYFITEEDIIKYGVNQTYDTKITESEDSVKVSFRIISDCCQTAAENIEIGNDTITISGNFLAGDLCDCYCDYYFEYKIPKRIKGNKKILIKR